MKNTHARFAARTLVIAVQGALLATAGSAAVAAENDDAIKALTQPTNTFEAGVGGVSQDPVHQAVDGLVIACNQPVVSFF